MNRIFKIRFRNLSRAVLTFLFVVISFASVQATEGTKNRIVAAASFRCQNSSFDENLSRLDSATTDVTILIRQNDVTKIDFDFGTMPVSAVRVDNEAAKFVQTR